MHVKRERAAATRRRLLEVARHSFGERGYAASSLEEIAHTSGLTKGALYHHFAGKRALFGAVFEAVERGLVIRVGRAARGEPDPRRRLRRGVESFLDACLEPEVQRILLIDGIAVLGLAAWREIDARHWTKGLDGQLARVLPAGGPSAALARMLSGALTEGAFHIAASTDPRAARSDVLTAFDALLRSL